MDNTTIFNNLLDKEQQLSQRVLSIENDLKKTHSQNFAEQVTERENDEVLENILNEAKFELQQVKNALVRLKNKQYGICSNCSKEIASARLQALPYINTCIECAQ